MTSPNCTRVYKQKFTVSPVYTLPLLKNTVGDVEIFRKQIHAYNSDILYGLKFCENNILWLVKRWNMSHKKIYFSTTFFLLCQAKRKSVFCESTYETYRTWRYTRVHIFRFFWHIHICLTCILNKGCICQNGALACKLQIKVVKNAGNILFLSH